jgi:hypothetical protein
MAYILDIIELALLGYLAGKAWQAKPVELRDLVKQAISERVAGSGRERLRESIARLQEKRAQRRAGRSA